MQSEDLKSTPVSTVQLKLKVITLLVQLSYRNLKKVIVKYTISAVTNFFHSQTFRTHFV